VTNVGITIDHSGKAALVTGPGAAHRTGDRALARPRRAAVRGQRPRAEKAADTFAEEAEGDVPSRRLGRLSLRRAGRRHGQRTHRPTSWGGLDYAGHNIGMLAGRGTTSAVRRSRRAYWPDGRGPELILTAGCAQHEARAMLAGGRGA